MAALPIEILLGIYLGVLTGIIPALVSWVLGFTFKYVTGVTIPGLGVVVLGLAIAGVSGGLLALNDPTVKATGSRTLVAIVVVTMLALYAHSKGDQLGAQLPKRISLNRLREQTLSRDVIERIGGRDEVRVTIAGQVADMEGYPPLPEDLRTTIQHEEWSFPADLPLSELESRLAQRLRTEYDLADTSVSVNEQGRATISAAPPLSGLSKRVTNGKRAVSVDTTIPTGVARGDHVQVRTGDERIEGTVVSARSGDSSNAESNPVANSNPEENDDQLEPSLLRAPTTTGGEGRLTVAVDRADADELIPTERPDIVVESRGVRREFELVSLLRRAGERLRKFSVAADSKVVDKTLEELNVRESFHVVILAVRRPEGWIVAPRGDMVLTAGDEMMAVGARDALDRFAEVVA